VSRRQEPLVSNPPPTGFKRLGLILVLVTLAAIGIDVTANWHAKHGRSTKHTWTENDTRHLESDMLMIYGHRGDQAPRCDQMNNPEPRIFDCLMFNWRGDPVAAYRVTVYDDDPFNSVALRTA
jgi:hypothetical protein